MLLPDFVVDLVEGLGELFFVVLGEDVAVVVVLGETGQEGPELEAVVAVVDVLEQEVLGVLLEDVEGEVDGEEVGDLFLEASPHLLLHVRQRHQLLPVQHADRRH